MDEISYSGSSASHKKRRISKRLVMFIFIALIVLVLIGGIAYFVTRKGEENKDDSAIITLPEEKQESQNTPTPEVSVTPITSITPTPAAKSPTPKASVSPSSTKAASAETAKSDISIAIQNGSGETGVAGKASDVLKAAGYTIASTGNADNYDYKDVVIKIKPSQKANLAGIEKALSSNYTIGDTSTDLSEGQSYDVLVIIGK
jgi:hypothetical protein